MSPRAPSVCATPGCSRPAPPGQSRCEPHRLERQRASNAGKPSAAARGYDAKWRKFRRQYLAIHPTCVECGAAATDVDHVDGLGPLGPRGYDEANCAAMCRPCHARKTARHDGSFGRARDPLLEGGDRPNLGMAGTEGGCPAGCVTSERIGPVTPRRRHDRP